jgi:hypothetical protein
MPEIVVDDENAPTKRRAAAVKHCGPFLPTGA